MRQGGWLAGAIALLLLAGWLLSRGEAPPGHGRRAERLEELDFPRYPRSEELERTARRRILPPAPSSDPDHDRFDETSDGRDPLLAAMRGDAELALVVEAGTFLHLPVGRLLLDCLVSRSGEELARVREELGMSLDSIDRIAFTVDRQDRPLFLMSGKIDEGIVRSATAHTATHAAYGDRGSLLVPRTVASDSAGPPLSPRMALWSDSLLMVAESEERLKGALDRIERRGTMPPPSISSDQAYGEIYGKLSARAFRELLPEHLAGSLEVADHVELHVDATEDVLLVADVYGRDEAGMTDLARTFGGALSALRFGAKAEENADLVELLDVARVMPGTGSFRLETALPLSMIEKRLADCRPASAPP